MNRVPTIGLLAVAILLAFTTANASEQTSDSYACVLDGASVVPPQFPYPHNPAGRIDLALNAANELSYYMYECVGYLAPIEAHIHGPAPAGALGPVIFTIPPATGPYDYDRSGVLGVLNQQQIRDLNCGLWYVDIHTPDQPFGLLRGQLRGLWGWQPAWPCFLATEKTTWGEVKAMYR